MTSANAFTRCYHKNIILDIVLINIFLKRDKRRLCGSCSSYGSVSVAALSNDQSQNASK